MVKLLTSKEVAALLRINPMTVNRSRFTGVLLGQPAPEHKKIGKSVRYDENIINDWILSLWEAK